MAENNRKLFAYLIILFVITQALGLWTANALIREDVRADIVPGKAAEPEEVENSVWLFGYIIAFTAVMLLAIKIFRGRLLYILFKIFEGIAIFGTSMLVFSSFVNSIIVLVPSAILVMLRNIYAKNIWLRNLTSVLATAGAGALMGVSLGVLPVLVFMFLLAFYDIIAVFKTKHMVRLAEAITKKNLSFTYALPTPEHTFELGTGDMVVPLMFAASVMGASRKVHIFPFYLFPPMLILAASLLGLLWTINYCAKKPGRALPALPPQTVLMALAWLAFAIAGF